MSDNRVTEKLCKLLEERGIEFKVFDVLTEKAITWSGNVCHWVAVTDDLGLAVAVYKDYLTPEQVIAATLGSGTLTAEQVREVIMSVDRWEKPMGNTGLTNTHLIIRDDAWQAIANKLNAELGSGTCENIAPDYLDFLCSKCGFVHYHSDENDMGDGNDWNFCPNCGRKVVSV